jgi:hypothetical protein
MNSPPKFETTAITTGLSYVGCNADLGQGIYMNTILHKNKMFMPKLSPFSKFGAVKYHGDLAGSAP